MTEARVHDCYQYLVWRKPGTIAGPFGDVELKEIEPKVVEAVDAFSAARKFRGSIADYRHGLSLMVVRLPEPEDEFYFRYENPEFQDRVARDAGGVKAYRMRPAELVPVEVSADD